MSITAFVVLFYFLPTPAPPPHPTPKVFGFGCISGLDLIGLGGGAVVPKCLPLRGDANGIKIDLNTTVVKMVH